MGSKSKIRVYQLAKALGLSSTEVIERLAEAGIPVKSHSSSVDEAAARAALSKRVIPEREPPKKVKRDRPPAKAKRAKRTKKRKKEAETPIEPPMELEPPQVDVHPPEGPVIEESAPEEERPAPEIEEAVPPTEPPELEEPVNPAITLKPGLEPELVKRVADELGFDVEVIPGAPPEGKDPSPVSKVIRVPEMITVREFGEKLAISPGRIIKELKKMGIVATADWSLNPDLARRVAAEFGFDVEVSRVEVELLEVMEVMGNVGLGETPETEQYEGEDQHRLKLDDIHQRIKQGLVRVRVKEEHEEKQEEEQGQAVASRGTITIAEGPDRDSDWFLPSGASPVPTARPPRLELLPTMGAIIAIVLLVLTMPRPHETPSPGAIATITPVQAESPGTLDQTSQWKILRYFPRAGQVDQSRGSAIQIFFNRPVKQDVVEQAFSIDPGEPGTFSWPKPNRLVFTPKESLLPGTEYTISLKPVSETQPGEEYILPGIHWSFTTGGIRSYRNDINPLVAAHCSQCHGPKGPAAGVSFETYDDVSKYVVAGRADESRFYTFIQARKNHVNPWPRQWGHSNNDKLTIIKDWIDEDLVAE